MAKRTSSESASLRPDLMPMAWLAAERGRRDTHPQELVLQVLRVLVVRCATSFGGRWAKSGATDRDRGLSWTAAASFPAMDGAASHLHSSRRAYSVCRVVVLVNAGSNCSHYLTHFAAQFAADQMFDPPTWIPLHDASPKTLCLPTLFPLQRTSQTFRSRTLQRRHTADVIYTLK